MNINVAADGALSFDINRTIEVKFDNEKCGMNTTQEQVFVQVNENIRRGLPQIQPHPLNPETALLVCGGPSLANSEDELREALWRGGKIVTVNNAYNWCIDRGLKPSATVMLDAREFNKRFVERPVPLCKYLLASQCHPSAFELCRDRETYIWHAVSYGDEEVAILNEYYFKRCCPITMGTSVALRAISLLRMLGFTTLDIFGLDSCWLDGKHHGYDQPENDRDLRLDVVLHTPGRDDMTRHFLCAPWHMKQAQDFQELVKERGKHFRLNVRGPGLIAELMRTGSVMSLGEQAAA